MADFIKLLPDAVANQIAAGEVIQRPASAVKELMENAIDADATQIQLVIKDAGRTLIQVIDNGKGMSETDARMCFERHATSKINHASDLFTIRTMGFRGEALASIAAIARVELRTRTAEATLGTEITIEGSALVEQRPCNCAKGTNIQVKNLFFNTPARRNFLKNDNIEKSHIVQELYRVALAYPQISFSYTSNNELVYQFEKSNLKQRIINAFGSDYSQRLVPVEERTEFVSISGYVVKPEFAKKKRGEQYFFVNNRFIRSAYLNNAVEWAFEELISAEMHPGFFLYLTTDPAQIDVNVHPTKTEIKFQDEKFIYQVLKASVKRALGRFNISPTLDFDQETGFGDFHFPKGKPLNPPTIAVNPEFNPFGTNKVPSRPPVNLTERINPGQWEKLYTDSDQNADNQQLSSGAYIPGQQIFAGNELDAEIEVPGAQKVVQLQKRYILTPVKSGLMIIDQQRAHERILYESLLKRTESGRVASQHLLFPENISLSEPDAELLRDILAQVEHIGFHISSIGKSSFVIGAVPAEMAENENLQYALEEILENFRLNRIESKLDATTNLARSLARRLSVKHGKVLSDSEMMNIINTLFACEIPEATPSGKPVLAIMPVSEFTSRFK